MDLHTVGYTHGYCIKPFQGCTAFSKHALRFEILLESLWKLYFKT